MDEEWNKLSRDQQRLILKQFPAGVLAKQYNKPEDYFEKLLEFVNSIPPETSASRKNHNPPKTLILNARRDLSFYEANFELIDNSIDEWRKNGASNLLEVQIKYNIDLGTGEFEDNAGGMEESDVYKVFIPGESTNDDYSQTVIGSFGMGAKKAIFRLSDGARVISCTNTEFSVTSAVPEKWENDKDWETSDGRCEPIGVGRTRFVFMKLVLPPTTADLAELSRRVGQIYAPLLRGELGTNKVSITINDVPVDPAPKIVYSGADGAGPRTYQYNHTFKNILNSGKDVTIQVLFTCGVLTGLPGAGSDREEDWGVDAYGNGRLIQSHLKKEVGFGQPGVKGLGTNTQGTKLVRGELYITGHSMGIPWDTHKREYLPDHPVSEWIAREIRPRLQDYAYIGNNFASSTEVRQKELHKKFADPIPVYSIGTGELPPEAKPKWQFPAPPPAAKKIQPQGGVGKGPVSVGPAPAQEPDQEADSEDVLLSTDTASLTLTFSEQDKLSLMERFGASSDDELATAIVDCLLNGVAFRLAAEQLSKATEFFEAKDSAELSEIFAQEILALTDQDTK